MIMEFNPTHINKETKEVIMFICQTNAHTNKVGYPRMAVYKDEDQCIWSNYLVEFNEIFEDL